MVQMVMKYKVYLTEAITGYCYCHVKINNNGKGITIVDLDNKTARKIIKSADLKLVNMDRQYGRIYDDGRFKEFVNSRPKLKNILINLIKKIDE